MPRSVYIICAQGSSEDKDLNAVSLFTVIEKVELSQTVPLLATGQMFYFVKWQPWKIVAVWMHEEADPWEQEYETEFRLLLPNGKITPLASTRFRFDQPLGQRPFARLSLAFDDPPTLSAGVVKIENRIRPVGSNDWITQDYPIVVEEPQAPQQKANQIPAPT